MGRPSGTLAVWGLGHIGASIVLAARQRGMARTILGHDLDNETATAMATHLEPVSSPDALQQADLLILAVPPMALASCFERIAAWSRRPAVISDVASIKEPVCRWAHAALGREAMPCFVPAHPIAGNEGKGYAAACPDLFGKRPVVITPHETTTAQAVERICAFWTGLDARPVLMDCREHDRLLAALSHLPHAAAFALAGSTAGAASAWDDAVGSLPRSLREMLRVAGSDPELWAQIFLLNRQALAAHLGGYIEALEELRTALYQGKLATIARWCADSHIGYGNAADRRDG
jgi:prephenate dehydrogenase